MARHQLASRQNKSERNATDIDDDGGSKRALYWNWIMIVSLVGAVMYRIFDRIPGLESPLDSIRVEEANTTSLHLEDEDEANITALHLEEEEEASTTSWKWPINEENFHFCQLNNFVRNRNDPVNSQFDPIRPYSISTKTFQALASSHEAVCSSVQDVVHAVAAGRRHWLNASHEALEDPVEREKHPSYFVPAECNLPALSTHQLCNSMDQFSHIITIGDSLTRHLRQAFFMSLRDDLVAGAMVQHQGNVDPNEFYDCRCDGQFSEHAACRSLGALFWEMSNPSEAHVCSHLPIRQGYNRFRFTVNWNDALLQTQCTPKDQIDNFRGILLVLQGGVHLKTNAAKYIETLETFFRQPGFQECMKHKQVHVLWTTYNAQSLTLNARYRHQNHTNALAFNQQVIAYLQKQPFPVYIFDVFNLTLDAQTSDGFHYLSDVNLLKAHFILHLANRIKQEEQELKRQQENQQRLPLNETIPPPPDTQLPQNRTNNTNSTSS